MKKYLPWFFLFSAFLAAVIFLISGKIGEEGSKITWMICLYFAVTTLIFHYGIVLTTKSRPQVFIRYYMAATTFKLLLHLIIIVLFAITYKELATRFIITFMIMYLLFTVFEVAVVWLKIKK
jgi:hypothetical protein